MNNSIKSILSAAFLGAILLCGIAAILACLDRDNRAYSACQLNLPPNTVSMAVYADNASCDQLPTLFSGYVSMTFSNIADGSSLLNNTSYTGLCADLEGYILDFTSSNATYQVQLLSSADNPTYKSRPWDKINYILNNTSQYNWLDVQTAVWQLIYPDTSPPLPYGCNVNQANVQNIVNDANANGSGFAPGNGNLFAIIIDPQSCTGSSGDYNSYCSDPDHTPYQLLFTTATCSASYTVTPSAGAGGSISPLTPQTVNHGATTSFTVISDAGYHAVMSGTCGGNLAGTTYTTNAITADCSVIASFAINTFTITSSAGANGSISPSGAVAVDYGTNQSFTITPAPGYQVSDVLVDGSSIGAVTSHTFNTVTADHTISASFAAIPPLSITTSSLPSGTVLSPYSQTVAAIGGVVPYSWSISGGSLPDGLNINGSTGEISGSPTKAGTFNFTAQVTDSTSSSAIRNLSIATAALPVRYGTPGSPTNPETVIQNAYDHCADGYVIQVQAMDFPTNDIFFDRPVTITLQGGFDENFTSNQSFTTVSGTLTIRDGTVVIENIVVK
jgi:hypothetical protein